MKRIITFISFGIFIISIIAFARFGKQIRDLYSPHVDVIPITEHIFPSGMYAQVVRSSCISASDEGTADAYILEEKTDTGERAYYAKKIEVSVGESDEKYTELRKVTDFTALYISSSDRALTDGKRVVIERIVN
jgi:hypothetical protein